jgi:hypothetical protein
MMTVQLTDFSRIGELLRGSDELSRFYCRVMAEVVKANAESVWMLAEGDVFDDLMNLTRPSHSFLVRNAAVKAIGSCLPYCDFTVTARLFLLGIIETLGDMIEAFDSTIPKAIWIGVAALLQHLQWLTIPEIQCYWGQMQRKGIAQLIDRSEQEKELCIQVRSHRDRILTYLRDGLPDHSFPP